MPGPVLEAGLKSGEERDVIADGHIDSDVRRAQMLGRSDLCLESLDFTC